MADNTAVPAAAGAEANAAIAGGGAQLRVLVVHDGGTHNQQDLLLQDLLGHFSIKPRIVTESAYRAGNLEDYDVIFYLKRNDSPAPGDLLADIARTGKTVVWIGAGFNQFAAGRPMTERYGFTFVKSVSGTFTDVRYGGQKMTKPEPQADLVSITDPGKAVLCADMIGTDPDAPAPYIVRGANLWHVADNPLTGVSQYTSYMAFADLLHEMVGVPHSTRHQALIRIEDVHPMADQQKLRAIADYLKSQNIPFAVALIPVYVNPATGQQVSMSDSPGFVGTIRYMQDRGGAIVLHGYTHQYRGETAIDYEFWDSEANAPPAAESEGWIKSRLAAALDETHRNGIYPIAWETPHYTADPFTATIIARFFPVYYGRRGDEAAPFILDTDRYGQEVIPENMGYVQLPSAIHGDSPVPETGGLVTVRDGVASAFFHPFLNISFLKQLVANIRNTGFTFVSLDSLVPKERLPHPVDISVRDRIQNLVSDMKQTADNKGMPGISWFSLVGLGILIYYGVVFGLGRRVHYPLPATDPRLMFIFVIPALNEEEVIAGTLDRLLALPDRNVRIMVMNDDSSDRTAEIVGGYAARSQRADLVNRPPQIARRGKGAVLNHAFRLVKNSPLAAEFGTENMVLCVLDADGQVAPNIISSVTPYFEDRQTGAVQASVRIYNAYVNVLTRWQQFEFLTFNRIFQRGRESMGSVGLGGNGQFVRLSALASLGEEPWTDCLTEDLDIGLRLMLSGWTNHFAGRTFVAQQAATRLRTLLRQRSRWFQGHVTCWSHIPGILTSSLRLATRIDSTYYLTGIALVFLFFPASFLLLAITVYALLSGAATVGDLLYGAFLPYLLLFYVLSFGPLPVMAFIYWREDGKVSLPGALLWAHIFAVIYSVWFAAGCVAVGRLLSGKSSWTKTPRSYPVEPPG
ncbi:MAG: DUF2334 domain-containing protein [Actinomycetota bacterium]|nr:DUF2334 domain-containing protein [Actinomycetota bacterium]